VNSDTDVLIVGGSLVGLSAALLLRLHGVDCLVVERHTGTAIHPRAGHFHPAHGRDTALGRPGGERAAKGRGALSPRRRDQQRRVTAWKLALVLSGAAAPDLLETYDEERRPIGELTIEQAYARYVTRVAPYLGTEGMQPLVDDFSMEIGYRYNSWAVMLARR
jgi:glycine/D-amino acid oxidase-like deaminating enzyme